MKNGNNRPPQGEELLTKWKVKGKAQKLNGMNPLLTSQVKIFGGINLP